MRQLVIVAQDVEHPKQTSKSTSPVGTHPKQTSNLLAQWRIPGSSTDVKFRCDFHVKTSKTAQHTKELPFDQLDDDEFYLSWLLSPLQAYQERFVLGNQACLEFLAH